ncbi:hypothetical protein GCM10027586_19470 [Kineococcus gypseus]|uniref:nitroreductase family deazaflavin-dependent oxidoreductase n=1 Tax=Kineococcus gypseus TaxID=1637102 RepID=UPI003D7CEBFC
MGTIDATASRAFARTAMAVRPGSTGSRVLSAAFRGHVRLYRATGGRIGARMDTAVLCLLTTTGRVSGAPRTHVLGCVLDGEHLAVVASNSGSPEHPQWYRNLVAEPRVRVQIGPRAFTAVARTTSGQERERLWRRALDTAGILEDYQRRTTRQLPVVLLEPVDARGAEVVAALAEPVTGSAGVQRALVAASTVQLAAQLAGQVLALRRGAAFDVALLRWRGRPERIGRDSWLYGTGFSAPVPMMVLQAVSTVRLARAPQPVAARALGVLGTVMVLGYVVERETRAVLRPAGRDPVATPVVATCLATAAVMARWGRRAATRG